MVDAGSDGRGVVVPKFVVVSIENKHAPVVLTQLPAGAAILTSEPTLLKPTLVPALRRPTTPITPGQLAGILVTALSLPAEATIMIP